MAQYKVPQDVEADDKLLGPFSFRQFVYLLIAGGLIALTVGLFQLFPILAIIPLPFILLFGALALPLRRDQPMETYLVALVSYYLKPKTQLWKSGQRESTIEITAPKIVEVDRTRNITGEEATHRLSFLADVVDSGGQSVRTNVNHVNSELAEEANNTRDMFESGGSIGATIKHDENKRHNEVIEQMKEEIEKNEQIGEWAAPMEEKKIPTAPTGNEFLLPTSGPNFNSSAVVMPGLNTPQQKPVAEEPKKAETISQNPSIIELANNSDYSVATIAKEANRIKERDEGEVFISLH